MDPLTRGSLFHKAQAEFYRALQQAGGAAGDARDGGGRPRRLDAVLDRVADEYPEMLAPAIERVWDDEVEVASRRPAHLARQVGRGTGRVGALRLRAGLRAAGRARPDARSIRDEVTLDGGWRLRGSSTSWSGGAGRPASRHRPQDRPEPHGRRPRGRQGRGAPARALRPRGGADLRRPRGRVAPRVLHARGRVLRARRPHDAAQPPPRARGRRADRRLDRARFSSPGSAPEGLWPSASEPR